MRHDIITGLQQAGTFAASTGLRHPPPEFAAYASQPIFPQIQAAVSDAYIDGTLLIFRIAALLLVLGLLAALILVRPAAAPPAWPPGGSKPAEIPPAH